MKWICIAVMLALSVSAEETNLTFATLTGTGWTNARLLKVEANGIMVISGHAGARIHFTNLPPELQAKFNYDAQRARDFDRRVLESQRAYAARESALVQRLAQEQSTAESYKKRKEAFLARAVEFTAKISQIEDGRLHVYRYVEWTKTSNERIAIINYPDYSEHSTGGAIPVVAVMKGTFRYRSLVGDEMEIPLYDAGIPSEFKNDPKVVAVFRPNNEPYIDYIRRVGRTP